MSSVDQRHMKARRPKASARFIAAAPEMWTALVAAKCALSAAKDFMNCSRLFEILELNEIIMAIDDILVK